MRDHAAVGSVEEATRVVECFARGGSCGCSAGGWRCILLLGLAAPLKGGIEEKDWRGGEGRAGGREECSGGHPGQSE